MLTEQALKWASENVVDGQLPNGGVPYDAVEQHVKIVGKEVQIRTTFSYQGQPMVEIPVSTAYDESTLTLRGLRGTLDVTVGTNRKEEDHDQ
jgi:hypothetical protein